MTIRNLMNSQLIRTDHNPRRRNLAFERDLLVTSGLFDEAAYIRQAGEEARQDPIGHYLQKGWNLGFEPNPSSPGAMLRSCFASLGVDEPPMITWLMLRSTGWPLPEGPEEMFALAAQVRATGLFDAAYYTAQLSDHSIGFDPAVHYVTLGERIGFAPSPEFDPVYYAASCPDVVRTGMNLLLHYAFHGRAEGRNGHPAQVMTSGHRKIDPRKNNVILVVHDTSRTGAPILGWNIALHLAQCYNLFTVQIGEGDLTADFQALSVEMYGPFPQARRNKVDIEYSLRSFLDARRYRYAIINSAESRIVLESCTRRFIPTVLLMHEFASSVIPVSSLFSALDRSTEIVFPASIVARSAEEAYPPLRSREVHVIPQGEVRLPRNTRTLKHISTRSSTSRKCTSLRDVDGAFIVLGVGTVCFRKGVDLFLAAAAEVVRLQPTRPVHFIWVGPDSQPQVEYLALLQEQLARSALGAHVTFLDEVSELEPIYRLTDVFFLSSRLDPLPNVTIDAAVRGIPVVCFNEASGMADLMLKNPQTALGVVDYVDSAAAARIIFQLAEDEVLWRRSSEAIRELGSLNFDMNAYINQLDEVGMKAAARMKQREIDAETLRMDPAFDQDMFLEPGLFAETRDVTITSYLTLAAAHGSNTSPTQVLQLRRPSPGFHPQIYAAAHASRLAGLIDPLADFVRRGKPAGPWQATVLRPDDLTDQTIPEGQSVALHAHFFYPDLCSDFLAHLRPNQARCDLLVSTDNAVKAAQLRRSLETYAKGRVDIRVVPNRGRDIGPLLTAFAGDLNRYDLIGHIHSKRTLWCGREGLGGSWREFLWQNLLGGLYPMMDLIVAAFGKRQNLGLVFPCNPNLIGWDDNRVHAEEIAARMGWKGPLPDYFEFPVGTMFWIRPNALRPLLDLKLSWNDYPEEPVPSDGTILHALERLLTTTCQLAQFTYGVTHVPGVSWTPGI